MKKTNTHKPFPVKAAGGLDNKIRRMLQDPKKIMRPFIKGNMSVLDFGCGPGFFTVDIAEMLDDEGKVTAADLQQGMLDRVSKKIKGTRSEQKIRLHKCEQNSIGLTEKFDLIFAFYMIHEVPDQDLLFKEFKPLLKPDGKILIIEPKVHVSKAEFCAMTEKIKEQGYEVADEPKISFSRALLLKDAGLSMKQA